MPRIGDPKPDLGHLRRALNLTPQEGANLLGIRLEVLVHYESKGYGYNPSHDMDALDAYLAWAIAAYGSDQLYYELFPLDHTHKKKDRPAATERPRPTFKKGKRL